MQSAFKTLPLLSCFCNSEINTEKQLKSYVISWKHLLPHRNQVEPGEEAEEGQNAAL